MPASIESLSKFSEHSSAENAKIIADPNATFTFCYWGTLSAGGTARDLLAYGKVLWKNQLVEYDEWIAGHYKTPFRNIPTLKIQSNGKEATIAETIVVDQFLAKRFNLLGENEWEEYHIKAFYSNIHYLRERAYQTVTWPDPDKRKAGLEKFLTQTLPAFIEDHAFHLKNNGSNGHYVGDKLTLADIHMANIIDHFATLPSGEATSALFKKNTPLWRVKEEVEKNAEIRTWRESEDYQTFLKDSVIAYSRTAPPA
ncbi:hypothetical protein BGZ94_006233 [Podila epigama]|nr:hypothetical protein BGZ94_006233 [Podila epigama]